MQIDRSLKSNILKKDLKHIDDVLEAENEIMESSLGMISHKKSLITIFGHKHFRQKIH